MQMLVAFRRIPDNEVLFLIFDFRVELEVGFVFQQARLM